MSITPPPPPGATSRAGEPLDRALTALADIEQRLARIEDHSRASRSSLGWLVIVLVVLPTILFFVALVLALSGESLTITSG